MRKQEVYITLTLTLLFITVLTLTAGCARIASPPGDHAPVREMAHPPVICGFYTNGRGPGSSLESLAINGKAIAEISPLWYYLRGDGSLVEEVDTEALKIARERGVKVLPLVALHKGESSVLTNPSARHSAMNNIARAVQDYNYDGINIDIEIIKRYGKDYHEEKKGITGLVAGLGQLLRPLGRRLDVSVIPPWQPPSHLAPIYDYEALAGLAQRVVIMAYDYSHPGSAPGPVAPLPWVEENIKALMAKGSAPEKISLGIAAYGYDWPSDSTGGEARPSREIILMSIDRSLTLKWDEKAQVPYLRYTGDRKKPREIWFENALSTEKKIDLVKKFHLAGISLWRLGYEDPDFWRLLE